MAKVPANQGKPWSSSDIALLRKEIKQNTPTRVLGIHLKRTPIAVQAKANALGLSLKPNNRSPYGTAGKRKK
jgi:hypothetical protein